MDPEPPTARSYSPGLCQSTNVKLGPAQLEREFSPALPYTTELLEAERPWANVREVLSGEKRCWGHLQRWVQSPEREARQRNRPDSLRHPERGRKGKAAERPRGRAGSRPILAQSAAGGELDSTLPGGPGTCPGRRGRVCEQRTVHAPSSTFSRKI